MKNMSDKTSKYQADSLSLIGAVALGTGVMIGAGIFALTGQMAEMTGSLFHLAFLSAALIVSFSAYSYVKLSLEEIEANPVIPVVAIVLHLIVLGGFLWVKGTADPLVLIVAAVVMAAILITEFFFLRSQPSEEPPEHSHSG